MGLQLSDLILLQIAVILAISAIVAVALRPLRQPAVVAQMLVGILLGPSLLEQLLPGVHHWLFPPGSTTLIREVGQVGLVLFMFGVGTELNHHFLSRHVREAALVSGASLVAPLLVGGAISLALVHDARFFPEARSEWPKVVFFATAMAVTALPVMARIISDLGLGETRASNVAIAAGSVTDAAAWGLLALVLAGLSGNFDAAVLTLVGAAVFTLLTMTVVRMALAAIARPDSGVEEGRGQMTALVVVLLVAAFATSAIGIHPAFGAFMAGAVAPRNATTATLRSWLIGPLSFLLLPLFFVYAGLNTRATLIGSPQLVAIAVAIIIAACFSKGAVCWLAARAAGLSSPDAIAVGALMNARGLVELILLTVGLEQRIITSTLYSIMVLMTFATTFIASPILQSLHGLTAVNGDLQPTVGADAAGVQGQNVSRTGG